MSHFQYFIIGLILVIFIPIVCCTQTKQEYNKQGNDVALLKEKRALPTLTCDSVYIDENKNIVHFLFINNSNYSIGLTHFPDFEYKVDTEWKKIHLIPEITGYVGDEIAINSGKNFIRELSLKNYLLDSISDYFRIVQPYYLYNYQEENKANNEKILYKEFTFSELGVTH